MPTFFEIPPHPEEVSVNQNMLDAKERAGIVTGLFDYLWFRNQVKNRGPWDYKQLDRQFADFGNFNYGATGSAMGIPAEILYRLAGYAQKKAETSQDEWGTPWFKPPYGDDPADQALIKQGIKYAEEAGY